MCLGVGVQAPPGIAQGLILGPNSARVSKTGAHTARTQSNKNLDMKVRTEAMEGKYETRAGPGGQLGTGAFLCSLHDLP